MSKKLKEKNDFSFYVTNFFMLFLANQKNVSTNTIKSYRDTFKILLKYINNKSNITNMSLDILSKNLIINFLNYLENERGNSISTRNQRLACIHAFCKFVQGEEPKYINNFQQILNIPLKRKVQNSVEYLTTEAIEILLKQPKIHTKNGLRDLLILSLLYDTGARVQELIDLKVTDIRLEKPAIIKLHGKGDKYRQVPIMGNTQKILKEYIQKSPISNKEYLFESSANKRFTRNGIFYIIDKYTKRAKKESNLVPEKIYPHLFRHTKAMHLLQSGVNLIYIRDFLGHVDIRTTEIYAKYDTETKRKAIENAYSELIDTDLSNWEKDNDLLKWLESL